MIPLIGGWLAKSVLMQSPVGRVLKAVPPKVWLAILLCAAVFVAYRVHQHKVKAFGEERYTTGFKAGYAAAVEDGKKAAAATDKKTTAIAADVKGKNHEANARSNAAAGDLLVRGPGAASSRCPSVPAPAGGHDATTPAPDDAGPRLPPADREATVSWGWLVSRALQCDLDRNEVAAWREWYPRVVDAWPKPDVPK